MLWYSLTKLSMIRILLWFQILRICLACSFSASLSLIGRCSRCALVSLRLIALIANTRYGAVRGVWKETLLSRGWFSNNLSCWNMYNIWKSEKMCPKNCRCEKLCPKNWSVKSCAQKIEVWKIVTQFLRDLWKLQFFVTHFFSISWIGTQRFDRLVFSLNFK